MTEVASGDSTGSGASQTDSPDLVLKHATTADGRTCDIGIRGDRIFAIEPFIASAGNTILDASGGLTLPAFVNGQLHACKSFYRRNLSKLSEQERQLSRVDASRVVKAAYTEQDVFARVDETMLLAILNGTCAIRLFADVDDQAGLVALRALLDIRKKYAALMTVQVVAFPQDGVLGQKTQSLMRAALDLGADVVGGIPWIESTETLQRAHTDLCFALAREYDRPLHLVCDDAMDPALRTLEYVARQTVTTGMHGRVCATQCAALAAYDDAHAAEVIQLVRAAGVTIFSNSHVGLIATDIPMNGLVARQPMPRSTTRVRELLDAGVNVACGQDDIDNWFYPFGRNDPMECAQFMAHNAQFAWHGEVDRVLPMITVNPAAAMGVKDYGLAVGSQANLVVLDAPDWHQAIQYQPAKRFVILRGKVAAHSTRLEVVADV